MNRLAQLITRRWYLVLLAWLMFAALLRLVGPAWDDVTKDGDFQYLPADSPSVSGQALLDHWFPALSTKSHLVGVVARNSGQASELDVYVAYDLSRRFHLMAAVAQLAKLEAQTAASPAQPTDPPALDQSPSTTQETEPTNDTETDSASPNPDGATGPNNDTNQTPTTESQSSDNPTPAAPPSTTQLDPEIEAQALQVIEWLNRALSLTQSMYQFQTGTESSETPYFAPDEIDPIAVCLYNRSLAYRLLGNPTAADDDLTNALDIDPRIADTDGHSFPQSFRDLPIRKIWSWQTDGIGSAFMRLRDREAIARLVVLHLSTEFLAVENTHLFEVAQLELNRVDEWSSKFDRDGLATGLSGSAAVGSDLLLASIDSVRNTELFTIVLVTTILIIVYRAPLLVLVPLLTIGISLDVATHLLAMLTEVGSWPGFSWWTFSVFKTTKIFIVVILFGAGTDYCLFLISRLREELEHVSSPREGVSQALIKVSPALAASALTTILGLGTMFFAQFGKLSHSGPAIGLALSITLLACLTLTPALLSAFGRQLFWTPFSWPLFKRHNSPQTSDSQTTEPRTTESGFWSQVGRIVVRWPGTVLVTSLLALAIPAIHGQASTDKVTYDLLSGLDAQRPSRQGTDLLKAHFPVGESGPVIVLAEISSESGPQTREERLAAVQQQSYELAMKLEAIPGVDYVRSPQAPLGHRSTPGDPTQQVLRSLPLVQSLFVANLEDTTQPWLARFDVVLATDVFSLESTNTLNRILEVLNQSNWESDSLWTNSQFTVAGTTAAIRDLRQVTQQDSFRIQILVVIAVFLVLVVILRHPIICAYMIASVVLSFWVTVGLTDWVFSWTYGPSYQGLEWKVPLFLFVILVAVGEDYNVYLASRVFEEQDKHGPLRGLRLALSRTGGIITSCGLIMAGTFVAMTSPVWHHFVPAFVPWLGEWLAPEGGSLQGMIQMGFALTTGVLLDTFIVRPILLPAYLALVIRWQDAWAQKRRLQAARNAARQNTEEVSSSD